jgi:hypothetical protein
VVRGGGSRRPAKRRTMDDDDEEDEEESAEHASGDGFIKPDDAPVIYEGVDGEDTLEPQAAADDACEDSEDDEEEVPAPF